MSYTWTIPFSAAILDALLCLLVLLHNQRRDLKRVFVFFGLALVSWNLDIAALYYFRDYNRAFFWSQMFRYGMFFMPPTIYHISLFLVDRWQKGDGWVLVGGYGVAGLLCILNSLGLLVAELKTFSWGFYTVGLPLYNLYTASVLFFLPATVYRVLQEYRKTQSPRKRLQIKILLFGFAVSLPIGLTNLLPVYGIPFFPLGNSSNVFWCAAVTYAIIKHRLMDIDVVITKTTASVMALLFWLFPLWAATFYVQHRILGMKDRRLFLFALAIFVVSGLVFPRLLQWTERMVQKVLWGQKYGYLQALSQFHKAIVRVLDREKILSELVGVLTHALQVEFVRVYLLQGAEGAYREAWELAGSPARSFPLDSPFILALAQWQEPIVREEMALRPDQPSFQTLAQTLEALGGEVCIPLRLQDRLFGFILLGRKRNRDAFSAEDLRLLSTLGDEVAVALENARLYEELKKSQHLLARSDRLAALGTLAAGIAHEIRNPLVSIHTLTQLLPERIDDPEFRTSFLQIATQEIARVCGLIDNLLNFARPLPSAVREVDLHALLGQLVQLLGGQARKKNLRLTLVSDPSLPPLLVDEGQIKQVFMNLVLNAFQATPAGGEIVIAVQVLPGFRGKDYCRVEVRDMGPGIPPEHKEQIFDPFFTTKDSGTGLGLFLAHQIVAEHGGYMDVESRGERGTSFYVYLPCTSRKEAQVRESALHPRSPAGP